MRATSRVWLTIVVASSLDVGATIARGTEGYQGQLKQGFAAKLLEERAMAMGTEEVSLFVYRVVGLFGNVQHYDTYF